MVLAVNMDNNQPADFLCIEIDLAEFALGALVVPIFTAQSLCVTCTCWLGCSPPPALNLVLARALQS